MAMNGGYGIDRRDLERHFEGAYSEMVENRRAFRAASRCEICGAKPTHTKRHGPRIVATCKDHVGKVPTPEREVINSRLAEARARLAAIERGWAS
jgi:hypothetical protein